MYSKKFIVNWSDIDALQHMRHSAYYDYATQTRLMFMNENGFGMDWYKEHMIFPVLLREECIFKKEVRHHENITIDMRLLKMASDGSRWSIMHRMFKENEMESAQLIIDAGWIDVNTRKLTLPPLSLIQLFSKVEKCENFELVKR
jgi:acyl-CoA thioester hydrolase